MRLGRRTFLSLLALQLMAFREKSRASECEVGANKLRTKRKYSILQGYTDDQSAEFSITHECCENLRIEVVDKETGGRHYPSWLKIEDRPFSDWAVQKVQFQGLRLGREYKLQVLTRGDLVLDERSFGLLDVNKPNARFAICSCMDDSLHRKSVWDSLREQKPDMAFFIGDSVYADKISWLEKRPADPKQLWERYMEMRSRIEFYKADRLIPVVAVWDDHDYGANNQDRRYPFKTDAKEAFETFFAQSGESCQLEKGPGVSSSFSAFGQRFYLLDGRYFRSAPEDRDETFIGVEAEEWLFTQLAQYNVPSWLMLGNQWFGGYRKKESYEYDQPQSFAVFLQRLKGLRAPVVFVSGDVHYSEIMEIEPELLGYPTLEITSSSMHSMTAPGWHRVMYNPRRLMATSHHNFVVVESHVDSQGKLNGRATSFGSRGRQYFSHRFIVRS